MGNVLGKNTTWLETGGAAHVLAVNSLIDYRWAAAGTTNAPSATALDDYTTGANLSGIFTAKIYQVVNGAWKWTGCYMYNLYGVDPPLSFVSYSGGGYTYLCEAPVGTARSTASWRVTRITDATNDAIFAGTADFEHAATDLATVAALTYTLGA